MHNKNDKLRQRAIEILKSEQMENNSFKNSEMSEIIEELNIHQIELEQQNLELRESQQALEKINAKYNDLFNSAPVGYLITNRSGTILEANNTVCSLLKINRSEFLDKKITSYIHPDDQDSMYFIIRKMEEEKTIHSVQLRFLRKNASPLPVYLSVIGEENGNRRISLSDISILKKAEEALIRGQRMEAVIDFASNASHDLSNTLQGIMNYMELIILNSASFPGYQKLQAYYTSMSQMLKNMVSRIRQLQRLSDSSRYSELDKGEEGLVDMTQMIDEVISTIGKEWEITEKVQPRHIKLEKDVQRDLVVQGISYDLRFILIQLINNGAESIEEEGRILVEGRRRDKWVIIRISDTGTGMDRETERKLFEPFYTTKGYSTGLGMGLTGVYSIIREHKGEIEVLSSEKEEGTLIEIRLPVLSN